MMCLGRVMKRTSNGVIRLLLVFAHTKEDFFTYGTSLKIRGG